MPHGKSPKHVRKAKKKKAAAGTPRRRKASAGQSDGEKSSARPKATPAKRTASKLATSAQSTTASRSATTSRRAKQVSIPTPKARLQKLLASAGFASRREAEQYLIDGRVSVNGRVAELGESADPSVDDIRVDGERLVSEKPAYWILHKPRGVVTTLHDEEGRRTVVNLLPTNLERIYPVGRLDRETSGLLLLTNDGDTAHALLHPSLGNEREYKVVVKGQIDARAVGRLQKGIVLEEGRTSPGEVREVRYDSEKETSSLTLTLSEGKKRQIRRSLLMLGFPVRRLTRTRMGPLRLGRLPVGESRPLRPEEKRDLLAHVAALRAGERPKARPPRQRKPSSRKGTRK